MIIYTYADRAGFNPLAPLFKWFSVPTLLRSQSQRSRGVAVVNIVTSIVLCLFCSYWITGHLSFDSQSAALSAATLVAWRIASYLTLRKELFRIDESAKSIVFQINLFTIEWCIFYASMTLYLLSFQTLQIHKLINPALDLLAGISAAMMLLPLAQGSLAALTKQHSEPVTPARTRKTDAE